MLRAGVDAASFQSQSHGRALLRRCSSVEAASAWLSRAVDCLRAYEGGAVALRRSLRQWTILDRYDRRRHSRDVVCGDLGISLRLFYKERSAALARIAAMIAALDVPDRVSVQRSPTFGDELSRIDRLLASERSIPAVRELRMLEARANSSAQRLAAQSRRIVALARLGRLAEAGKVASDARRALVDVDDGASCGSFLLAELCRMRLAGDTLAYRNTFDSMQRERGAAASAGDQHALHQLTHAWLDLASTRVDAGDSDGARAAADRARDLLARTHWPDSECEIRAAVIDAGIDVDLPQRFSSAPKQAWDAFERAEAGGYRALATQALYQCVASALIARKPNRAERFVRLLHERAEETENAECRVRAILAATGVDYLRGRHDRALARLDAMNAREWPGSNDDVTVALLRARVLAGLQRFDEAIALLDSAASRASAHGLEQAIGLASLWKSRMAGRLHDASRARAESNASIEFLQRHPTPFQLYQAYHRAFEVTAQRRYRDCAGDLWQMIAPAFEERDDPAGLPSLPIDEPAASSAWSLTPRERSVAALVCRGRTNRQIASVLGIGVRTVDQHVASIMRRQNVAHRWEVAI